MRNSIIALAIVTFLIALTYVFSEQVAPYALRLYTRLVPCSEPVTYHIENFDERFGISPDEFLEAIKEAEIIWEGKFSKDLFSYQSKYGAIAMNLEYDYRQEAVDRLKGLGISIDKSRSSYESLKERFDALSGDVARRKKDLENRTNDFQHKQDIYNAQVQQWNSRGGAPQNTYEQLQSQKEALLAVASQIQADERLVNSDIETVNALATTLNRLANELNVDVAQYNAIGQTAGAEFEEALYESTIDAETITVYEYEDRAELVRVLAHELGHALGMDHVDDPLAIMYPVNQSDNLVPTTADIEELRRVCGAKQ